VARVTKPVGRFRAVVAQAWKLFVDDGWMALGILFWVARAFVARASEAIDPIVERAAFAGGLMAMLAMSALRRTWRPFVGETTSNRP
jgi:hypothetical protein